MNSKIRNRCLYIFTPPKKQLEFLNISLSTVSHFMGQNNYQYRWKILYLIMQISTNHNMAKLLMNLHLDLFYKSFYNWDHRVVKKIKCEFRKSFVQLFGANYGIKKVHISHALISLGKIVAMQYM